MTPAIAARRVGPTALLVQRPHSPVVHVAASPVGRRARLVPCCGTRGKRWRAGTSTLRRLCARCSSWVSRHTNPVALHPQEIADWASKALTIAELDQVADTVVMTGQVMAMAALPGITEGQRMARLHSHITVARIRIVGSQTYHQQRRFA